MPTFYSTNSTYKLVTAFVTKTKKEEILAPPEKNDKIVTDLQIIPKITEIKKDEDDVEEEINENKNLPQIALAPEKRDLEKISFLNFTIKRPPNS